jgi:hypothetical protein
MDARRRSIVVWRQESEGPDGAVIGPAWLVHRARDPDLNGRADRILSGVTREEAERYALEHNHEFLF